jgi:integrase
MVVKYRAQFLLDKEKDSFSAKLRYRIKWGKNIVAFGLGYRIDIEKWSLESQRCKNNTTHGKNKTPASVINRTIQKYEDAFLKIKNRSESEAIDLAPEEFRNLFNIEIGKEVSTKTKSSSFFEIYDIFIFDEAQNNQWNKRTIQKMQTQKKVLYEFDFEMRFEKFNEEYISSYQKFLEDKDHKNSTISKELAALKWFLKWAKRKGYNKFSEFELFKPKIKNIQKKIIFLNQSELKKLREFEIPEEKKNLEKIRDIFLFQCFTGLRYSDVFNLKKANIRENYIEVTTLKTSENLIIELNKLSKNILERYKDIEGEKALPVISNQKMNDYLKELAELAGINDLVTTTYYKGNVRFEEITPKYALLGTHAGRRTFVCNALSLGIPPNVVMKWTGHSDYKSMKPYIDIADEIKATAMDKFNLL